MIASGNSRRACIISSAASRDTKNITVEGDRRAVGVEEDAPLACSALQPERDHVAGRHFRTAAFLRRAPTGGDQRLQQPHFSCELRYGWAVTHSLRPDSLR